MGSIMDWLAGFVVPAIIAALTPVILAGIKKLAWFLEQRLPKAALPTIAPIIGALVEFLAGVQGIPGLPPGISGAILGAVGTWLRELYSQWKQLADHSYDDKVAM